MDKVIAKILLSSLFAKKTQETNVAELKRKRIYITLIEYKQQLTHAYVLVMVVVVLVVVLVVVVIGPIVSCACG